MTDGTGPASTGPVDAGANSASGAAAGDDLVERVVDSRTIYRGNYLTFRIDTVERTDGTRAQREVVGHPGAVAILALDEQNRVLMVRQYRAPAGRTLLEIPAGTLDIDANSGAIEDPDLAAPRELEEETGYRAGSLRRLTSFWTAPGIRDGAHAPLSRDGPRAARTRAASDRTRTSVSSSSTFRWTRRSALSIDGEIADAKSILALLWLDRLRRDGEADPGA